MVSSSQPLVVDVAAFAAWNRDRGVRLPYPIDLTAVDTAGQRMPDAGAELLDRLAAVCRRPRAAVFAMRVDPSGRTDVWVAVADERSAIRLTVDDATATLLPIRESELVTAVVDALPDRPPLWVERTTIDESAWNAALERVALDPAHARSALESAGLPVGVVEAMAAAVDHPVRIGVLGALAWNSASDGTVDGGADEAASGSRIGPSMASWYEYPGGAVIASLLQPRHAFRRTVTVEGYHADTARRALVEAYGSAQRAADPARGR